MNIRVFLRRIPCLKSIKRKVYKTFGIKELNKYGHMDPTATLSEKITLYNPKRLFMYEKTGIQYGAVIMNHRADFIIKRNSGAAFGLKVITGNHMRIKGKWYKDVTDEVKDIIDKESEYDRDVIVDEDVWIGANVTLLSGAHIGRGCDIGSGSVVRGIIPPYSIVVGNPAKIIGFVFTPKEIIEHEKSLYLENERIPEDILIKNYEKFFLKRSRYIRDFISN